MDPVGEIRRIIESIAKVVEQAQQNKEDGNLLMELAFQTFPFVDAACQGEALDPQLQWALEAVTDSLNFTEEAVKECCQQSGFLRLVNSSKNNDKLRQAAMKMGYALSLIPVATISMTRDMPQQLQELKDMMTYAKFNQTAAARQHFSDLREELEKTYRSHSNEVTETLRDLLKQTMQEYSGTMEQRLDDLVSLRMQLKDHTDKKDELEIHNLSFLIESMTESVRVARTLPVDTFEEFQRHLSCPISKEIMKDPVILRDSGYTYERNQIEEWMRLGRRTDPATRKEIVTGDLIDNVVIRGLAKHFVSTENKPTPIDQTERTQCLQPGLYEGRGRYVRPGNAIEYVFVVLLLEPDGNIQGCIFSAVPDFTDACSERLIFKGSWVTETDEMTFDDVLYTNKCKVTYDPKFRQTAFHLKGYAVRHNQKNDEERVNFAISHITRSPLLNRYQAHPGILEMDGSIILEEGREVRNKLVLVLEESHQLSGWMSLEKSVDSDGEFGRVMNGEWDDDGVVSLMLYFLKSANIDPEKVNEASNRVVKYKMNGTLHELVDTAGVTGPVFTGKYEGFRSDFCGDAEKEPIVAQVKKGVAYDFSYSYFREPSRCPSSCTCHQMKLLRLSAEPERHVRPGVVEIKHRRCIGGMDNLLALGVHDIYDTDTVVDRLHLCNWAYVTWASAYWQLKPAGFPNEFYILVHKQIAHQLDEVDGYLMPHRRTRVQEQGEQPTQIEADERVDAVASRCE